MRSPIRSCWNKINIININFNNIIISTLLLIAGTPLIFFIQQ